MGHIVRGLAKLQRELDMSRVTIIYGKSHPLF